jgi:dihydrolipoamide dehydrogenase
MYDLAIIGAGAAGIKCAKLALASRLKTVLIETDPDTFGGTCINSGCIPTKFFLQAAKANTPWEETFGAKNQTIEKIKQPLLAFFIKKNVDILWGRASFSDKNTLVVDNKKITAKNIVIATGSLPRTVFTHPRVITAEGLLETPTLPENILIVGAGYIGIEFAALLSRLGKKVSLIEQMPQILPNFDPQLADRLKVILEKKGIRIQLESLAQEKDFEDFDLTISATGRVPNLKDLRLENAGVSLNEFGWIETDRFMKTNVTNIYACGDISGKHLLAYVAEYQARLAIDSIGNFPNSEDYRIIPTCAFSIPQVAQVGILEEEARKKNISCRKLQSNFLRFSSSYVFDDTDGFLKIILDEKERVIGAGVISQAAAELINFFALCIRNSVTLSELKKCIFVHPTLSEIIPLFVSED